MARHGEHLAPLLGGRAGRDQRARPRAASTISTPSEIPEMMRLRRGKSWARGDEARGVLADQAAALADRGCNSACSGG